MENPELGELERFRPQWCLYWGGFFAKSQFAIWQPYLRRSRYRFIVLVDGEGSVPRSVLADAAGMGNVAFAHSGWPLARLTRVSSLRGVLYVGNRTQNFRAVNALPGLAHVFLGHGHSGKRASGARVATLYDSVFVASYTDLARFPQPARRRIRPLACAIGAPIVEGLESRADASPDGRPSRPRVLYMPTWEGYRSSASNYSSLEVVLAALRSAPPTRCAEFAFRPHPGTGRKQERFRALLEQYSPFVTTPPGAATTKPAAMNRADVVVCDISGVVSEFLFTRKPVVVPWGPHLKATSLTAARVRRLYPYAYLWDVRAQSLDEAVRAALADEQLTRRRQRFAESVFRGHRDLDEAARTFDVALSTLQWRRLPVPLRLLFETRLSLARRRRG